MKTVYPGHVLFFGLIRQSAPEQGQKKAKTLQTINKT